MISLGTPTGRRDRGVTTSKSRPLPVEHPRVTFPSVPAPGSKPPPCSSTMSPHSISPTDLCSARDGHPLWRAQGATFCGRNTVRQRALGSGQSHCACVLGMMSEYSMHGGSLPCGRCGARRGLGVRCCERNQSRHVPLAATACHCAGSLGASHIVLCSLLRP